jgi:hypothetical protein
MEKLFCFFPFPPMFLMCVCMFFFDVLFPLYNSFPKFLLFELYSNLPMFYIVLVIFQCFEAFTQSLFSGGEEVKKHCVLIKFFFTQEAPEDVQPDRRWNGRGQGHYARLLKQQVARPRLPIRVIYFKVLYK